MRISTLFWLGLVAFQQICVTAQEVDSPYRSPQTSGRFQRVLPYPPTLQRDVPPLQAYAPKLLRDSNRQAYQPKMVIDPRVAQPYRPLLQNGVVLQPYRPQLVGDVLVGLAPSTGYRIAGSAQNPAVYEGQNIITQVAYQSPALQLKEITNTPASTVPSQKAQETNYVNTVTIKETPAEILPTTTEAPSTTTTPCSNEAVSLPQQDTEPKAPVLSYVPEMKEPLMDQPAETINIYDGFHVSEMPLPSPLVFSYQPAIEVIQPAEEVIMAKDVFIPQYRPIVEQQEVRHQPVMETNAEPLPYQLVMEKAVPYQPMMQATLGAAAYRPNMEHLIEKQQPYRPTLENDVAIGVQPYRPTIAAHHEEVQPYRPTLGHDLPTPQSYRPALLPENTIAEPVRPIQSDQSTIPQATNGTTTYASPVEQPEALSSAKHQPEPVKANLGAEASHSGLSTELKPSAYDAQVADHLANAYKPEIKAETTEDTGSTIYAKNTSSDYVDVLKSDDFVKETSTQSADAVTEDSTNVTNSPTTTAATDNSEVTIAPLASTGLCAGLGDGVHRHPEKCNGIIQCDGARTYIMPSCPSGLLFNNRTKACDYPNFVKDCDAGLANDTQTVNNCDGHEHGAQVPDDKDCGVFHRCVWNAFVKMECPKGTFFNEMASVCDWPRAVPECSPDGVRRGSGANESEAQKKMTLKL